jgi:hypothetical protein
MVEMILFKLLLTALEASLPYLALEKKGRWTGKQQSK